MTLNPRRVQAVFLAALEQEALADRAAVLDCECGDDDELRRRVEALLTAHDQPDSRLDRPFIAAGDPGAAIRMQPADRTDMVDSPPSAPEELR